VFSGNISLDKQRADSASARGPVDPEIGRRATGATSLLVRAVGDGKTYVVKVETGQPWSYTQRFSTEAGVRRTYDLPVGGFQPVGMFLDPVRAHRLWTLRLSAGSRSTSSINRKARSNSLSVLSTVQAEVLNWVH